MLEDSLHSKLLQMEEHLLTSIARGPESVQEFERSWSAVQAMVESSFKGGLIDEETLVLAQQVVSRVEVIAQVFLDHHEESDNLAKSLQQDLEGILADLTLDDVFFDDKPQNSRRSMSVTTLPTRPPYLEIAYQWLLANMHNPYPSKATKTSIAVESGGSIKDVESWFRGVRKRIGWSALKAKHFSNKRSQIVEAATLFFKPSLPTTSQPQVHNLSFMTMMNCVKELYPELSKAAVFDRIHGSENLASEKHKRKRQPKAVRTEHAAQLYPSPVASPVQRPTQHQPHKRRRSSTPISDLEDSDRPQKRHRSESSDNVLCKRSSMLLPSPSPSPQPSSRIAPNIVTASIPSSASSNQSLSKRKRCTSQLDDQQPAKRPHLAPLSCEPRSLSHSLSIDNWLRDALNANGDVITDFPAAVTTETFDNLSPLDIGVYQYDFSPDSSNFALLPESPVTNGALDHIALIGATEVLSPEQIKHDIASDALYLPAVQGVDIHGLLEADVPTWDLQFNAFGPPYPDDVLSSLASPCDQTIPMVNPIFPTITATSEVLDLCWMSYLQPHGSFDIGIPSSDVPKSQVLSERNCADVPSSDFLYIDEKLVKRQRAQALRDELLQLEADLAS